MANQGAVKVDFSEFYTYLFNLRSKGVYKLQQKALLRAVRPMVKQAKENFKQLETVSGRLGKLADGQSKTTPKDKKRRIVIAQKMRKSKEPAVIVKLGYWKAVFFEFGAEDRRIRKRRGRVYTKRKRRSKNPWGYRGSISRGLYFNRAVDTTERQVIDNIGKEFLKVYELAMKKAQKKQKMQA